MKRMYQIIMISGWILMGSHLNFMAAPPLTLRQCMEYAVKKSSKIQIQQTHNADAQMQRREAILKAFTPSVTARTSVYSNFGRTVDPESNTYINMTSFNNNYAVNASLTLFNGFAAINNLKIAKMSIKMGVNEEKKLRDDICLAVMEAYFNVLFQSQMVSVLEAQVKAMEEHLHLACRQYELGQKGYADKVQMEADLADKELQLVETENRKNDAMLTLKDMMLWPIEEELPLVALQEDEKGKETFLELTVSEASFLDSEKEVSAQAKLYHPAVLLAQQEKEKAHLDLKTARGKFFPTLSLSGGWSTNYYTYPGKADYKAPSFGSQFKNNRGAYVQLTLSIPLYDRLSRHANLSRKKNAFRRASVAYDQTLRVIEAEVIRAIQDSRGAYRASLHAQKRFQVQQEAYRLGQRKLVQGLMSPVEFQTVSNSFLEAKAQQLNSRFTSFLKQCVVNYYKGISYIDQLN